MGPVYLGFLYWPNHKSLVSSLSFTFENVAGGCYPFLTSYMMNPYDIPAKEKDKDAPEDEFHSQYPPEVANRLPQTMKTLGYIFLGLIVLIFIVMPDYPVEVAKTDEEKTPLISRKHKNSTKSNISISDLTSRNSQLFK